MEPEVPCVALDLTAVIGSSKSPSLQCEMLSNDPRVPTNEYNGTGDTFGRRVTSFTCLRLHEDRLLHPQPKGVPKAGEHLGEDVGSSRVQAPASPRRKLTACECCRRGSWRYNRRWDSVRIPSIVSVQKKAWVTVHFRPVITYHTVAASHRINLTRARRSGTA